MQKLKIFLGSLIVLLGVSLISVISVVSANPAKSEAISIVNVEKTTSGNATILTYYYSDGTTSTIQVGNSYEGKLVIEVTKTTINDIDYYTMHYSDGTSSVIEVPIKSDKYLINISQSDNSDSYTLMYSDGSISTLDLTHESETHSIVNIEKNSNNGLDIYTFHYSDGSSLNIPVNNNQQSTASVNLLNIIQEYCEENNIDFDEYISGKLNNDYIKTATNKALRSSVSVWCVTKYEDTTRLTYNSTTNKREGTKSISSSAGAGTIYKIDTLNNGNIDPNGYSYIITNYHVVYSSYSTDINKMPTIVNSNVESS